MKDIMTKDEKAKILFDEYTSQSSGAEKHEYSESFLFGSDDACDGAGELCTMCCCMMCLGDCCDR